MRRVINGKVYDTDTATHVCALRCTASRGDFYYHDTSLYRTARGAFFIAGQGGPASMWSHPVGNNGSTGGDGIRVVTEDEARQYMEEAGCDEDDFKAAGLDVEEG